jgi:hypothetical protein
MTAPFGFGAALRTPDRRDYSLSLSQAPVVIPPVYMPDYSAIPVKDQGPKFGTCGGHAGANLVSLIEKQDLSPKYLWKQIKKIDQLPLDRTEMRFIFTSLRNFGVCHEALCPDFLDPTIQEYSDPKNITDAMLNDGYPHGVASYAFTNPPSWTQLKQAIYQNKVVIILVQSGNGWWTDAVGNDSWLEKDVLPLRLGIFEDNHFIAPWGYDEKYIYFRNSWSDQWGRRGDGYFDQSYMPHVLELGTSIDGPSTKQKLVTLYNKAVLNTQSVISNLKSRFD